MPIKKRNTNITIFASVLINITVYLKKKKRKKQMANNLWLFNIYYNYSWILMYIIGNNSHIENKPVKRYYYFVFEFQF